MSVLEFFNCQSFSINLVLSLSLHCISVVRNGIHIKNNLISYLNEIRTPKLKIDPKQKLLMEKLGNIER